MIEGVQIKDLVRHQDERGFFQELIRKTDDFFTPGFGQLSHSLVYPGIVKAWHGHTKQYQWTYVISGVLSIVLYDTRQESRTFKEKMQMLLGDGHKEQIYVLPPGVVHGYRCLNGPAHVLYVTSDVFDPEEEIRLPLSELEFDAR